jgi:26S proteasome non-ATPase regulatory subunit 10
MLNILLDVTSADSQDGRTALHWAGTGSNLGVTQLILSYQPDLEARDTMGWTPLMVAGKSC